MTFARIRGAGFAANTKLASTEMTALDIDHANSLDKTTAGDTISGTVVMASGAILNFLGGSQIATTPTTTCTIQLGGASSLSSQVAGAIYSTVAGGINGNVAGGITGGVAGGITAGVAGGITGGVAGGITGGVAGGITGGVAGGIQSGVDGGIKLTGTAADYPAFAARSRTIVYPCSDVAGIGALAAGTLLTVSLGNYPGFANGFVQASVANPSYLLESGTMKPNVIVTTSPGYIYYMPLRGLHNGATISSSSLYFIPTSSHVALPAQQPAYMIWRVAKDFSSASASLLAANYIQNAAANNAAYTNVLQTLTFVPNQNAVIDTANYLYYAYIYDECSTSAVVGNRFISIGITYSSITDMRFP